MRRLRVPARIVPLLFLGSALTASDPPHDGSRSIQCLSCHKAHGAVGGALTNVAGNANLCLSCHVSGGSAAAKALLAVNQALPGGGLPAGTSASGTSHRWDSGPAGRVVRGAPNTSSGIISVSGTYIGAYPTTIQIKISAAGQAGIARFDWQQTLNGTSTYGAWTTAVAASATGVALGSTGISLKFANGAGNPSFVLNDIFLLYVRPELRTPVTALLSERLENGQLMCSTCHDQHSQAAKPFDPASSATYTAGVTADRHFQRIANNTGQMCLDCHAARNVVAKGGPSHPIALAVPATTDYKAPATAVLDAAAKVQCQSCHKVHNAASTDGALLRVANATGALCKDCHTLADSSTANTHTNPTSGIVWPGDQYGGSSYPALTTAERGACKNCHTPHGWPDGAGGKYSKLLGARQDHLCLTCHDGAPAKDTRTQIVKAVRHPVARTSGSRMIGCGDCHNPHMAIAGVHAAPVSPVGDIRNRIRNAAGTTVYSGAMKGVDGVQFNFSTLTNWATAATSWFTKIGSGAPATAASGAEFEYQVCFKCHTSFDPVNSTLATTAIRTVAWGGVTSYYSTGTARFTNNSTAVAGTGTTWTSAMVGMYIQKTIDGPAYRIATFTSATSIGLASAYTGATDASAGAYTITREQTDLAQEFNPKNASYHPVVAGLTGGGSTLLAAGRMKAPWNAAANTTNKTGVGQQTMLCSDCHNTDAASPAAQGPHGSASQFMLKGANAANWPNVTLANRATSWCWNCHGTTTNSVHTRSDHGSATCHRCHIVVPHGGKIGRLMGTNTAGMPARYAYQGLKSNNWLRAFVKSGSYSESSCGSAQSGCTNHNLSSSASNSW